jgi:glycosyltransferase involved in cell wall biosynthesis
LTAGRSESARRFCCKLWPRLALPLSILHLTAGSDAGGLSRYIHDMAVACRADGHHVAVAGERGAWHWLFEQAGLTWIDQPLKQGPLALWKSARAVAEYVRANKVDVIHTHYRRPTLVARLANRRLNRAVPVLYTVHLSDLTLSGPMRWLSDFGDQTHVASTEARQWVIDQGRVRPERVSLIPHGVHVGQWPLTTSEPRRAAREKFALGEHDRVAAYVGRLDQRHPKNVPWLLDIAAKWKLEGRAPALKVLLAGEGPDEPMLRARIAAEGLGESVRLLGHQEPLAVYQAADLLMLPSGREGFSLVCAEAMCTGLPVLRTRTSGTADLIGAGGVDAGGWATSVEQDAYLAQAMSLLADPAVLMAARAPAASHIRSRFSFERQFEATIALYHQMAREQ